MYYRKTKTVQVESAYDPGKTNEIICPIKVTKCDPREIEQGLNEEMKQTSVLFLENTWWKNKTNAAYKGIIKNKEDLNKLFSSQNELIVHKITSNDRSGLVDEYNKMTQFIESQNDDMKQKFSLADETTCKKEFEYANKYKYQVKEVPKDYSAMKQLYAKEQKLGDKITQKFDRVMYKMANDDPYNTEIETQQQNKQNDKSRIKISRQRESDKA